jgi:hypothetical protein
LTFSGSLDPRTGGIVRPPADPSITLRGVHVLEADHAGELPQALGQ